MLIVDNYDSFTYNIVQYMQILGVEPIVIKNDEYTLDEIKQMQFTRILLSPGWGNPDNSGITMKLIDYYHNKLSILGVCLGMQCIAKYFGAEIICAPEPCHGKVSHVYFDKDFELFKDFHQGFDAVRYHSLIVSNFPKKYIKAKTRDKIPMAIQIGNKPIFGVQFHPEAILTHNGIKIFKNWIEACDN